MTLINEGNVMQGRITHLINPCQTSYEQNIFTTSVVKYFMSWFYTDEERGFALSISVGLRNANNTNNSTF